MPGRRSSSSTTGTCGTRSVSGSRPGSRTATTKVNWAGRITEGTVTGEPGGCTPGRPGRRRRADAAVGSGCRAVRAGRHAHVQGGGRGRAGDGARVAGLLPAGAPAGARGDPRL